MILFVVLGRLRRNIAWLNVRQCQNCRKEMVTTNKKQLDDHVTTHGDAWPGSKCFPDVYPA